MSIDGVTNIETVLVHRDPNTQRMYLHSVTTKENLLNQRVSSADAEASRRSGSTDSEGITRILQDLINRKDVSKVVDENGEPLVVYHGTDADFGVFDFERLGENTDGNASSEEYAQTAKVGAWFNTNPTGRSPEKYGAGYNADMPAFLSIKSPRTELSLDWLSQGLRGLTGEEYRQDSISEGYDGIALPDEEFGGISYIVFSPTQIKSAIGNTGGFDGTNPDIRASVSASRTSRPHTIATLTDAIDKAFGKGTTQALEASGAFKFITSAEIPADIDAYSVASSADALPDTPPATAAFDRARLPALRRAAARLDAPADGITFYVSDDGRAIVTGLKDAKIPARFQRFADANGLTFEARRSTGSSVLPKQKGYKPFYGGAMLVATARRAKARQQCGQGCVLLPLNSAEVKPIEAREEIAKAAGVGRDIVRQDERTAFVRTQTKVSDRKGQEKSRCLIFNHTHGTLVAQCQSTNGNIGQQCPTRGQR